MRHILLACHIQMPIRPTVCRIVTILCVKSMLSHFNPSASLHCKPYSAVILIGTHHIPKSERTDEDARFQRIIPKACQCGDGDAQPEGVLNRAMTAPASRWPLTIICCR